MPRINVNIAYQRMSSDSFDFLSHQDLHPEFYFSGDDVDVIEKELLLSFRTEVDERKFSPTVHAPFFDLNIGARDSQVSRVSFERLFWAVEVAALLKASLVVVHPGYGPWILGHKFDAWLSRAGKYLIKLCEHAASYGIKVAFENIYDAAPDDLAGLLDLVDSTNAGICLDIGHFNVFSKQPLERWLEILGPHIFELHLHDNDGSADQHLALGDGRIGYSQLMQWFNDLASEKKPVLTLELPHRTHVIKSVNILKDWLS
jgi:sugar phosphate isomerase/epimerase